MLEEVLLKIEKVAGTPGRDNHDTATSPSEETEEPPSKFKHQKKDTIDFFWNTGQFNSHCTYVQFCHWSWLLLKQASDQLQGWGFLHLVELAQGKISIVVMTSAI